MTIICMYCKPAKPGPKPAQLGRSRVVITRQKECRVLLGSRKRTQRRALTIVRTRECLKCRFRWKTYELPYPVASAVAAKKRIIARGTHR